MRIKIDLTEDKVKRSVYFTSDFHLFHHNVLKFDKRPFADVNEMQRTIEERWNDEVTADDIVIYLGDLSFAKPRDMEYLKSFLFTIQGHIHYVLGNHDDCKEIKALNRFETINDYLEVVITHLELQPDRSFKKVDTLFCCMHYPIYSWNKKHHKSIHLHGHCHGNLHHGETLNYYKNNKVMDVGCMLHDYKPISYLDVMSKLKHIKLEKLEKNNKLTT